MGSTPDGGLPPTDMNNPGCTLPTDCPSGICDTFANLGAGACVVDSEVIFVDNKNGGACTSGDGSRGSPKCTIPEALAALTVSKTRIYVAGSSAAYNIPKIGARSFSMYGPGPAAAQAILHGDGSSNSVLYTDTGSSSVTVDGFLIQPHSGLLGGPIANGVNCSGGAQLRLHRNRIINDNSGLLSSYKYGVLTSTCTLTMDGNWVSSFSMTGLELSAGLYTLTNNYIVDNSGVGVSLTSITDTSLFFQFNTITNNGSGASPPAGVYCGGSLRLANSIIYKNSDSSASQLGATCTFTKVVTDTTESSAAMGLNKTTVTFLTGGAYKLDPSKNPACIDAADTVPAVRADFFGTRRPLGKGYDIGAHEAN